MSRRQLSMLVPNCTSIISLEMTEPCLTCSVYTRSDRIRARLLRLLCPPRGILLCPGCLPSCECSVFSSSCLLVRNKSTNDRLTLSPFAAYIRQCPCYYTASFGLHVFYTAALLTSRTTWNSTRGRIQSSTPPESRVKADCCRSQASSYLGTVYPPVTPFFHFLDFTNYYFLELFFVPLIPA